MIINSKKILRLLLVFGVFVLLTAAVLLFNAPPAPQTAHAAAKVSLNYKIVYMVPGQKLTLKLKNTGKTPRFTLTGESAAGVSDDGTVKAKKNGKAAVTATLNGKKYECTVKIIGKSKYNERSKNRYLRMLAQQKLTWASGKASTKNLKYQFADLGSNDCTDLIVHNKKAAGEKKYRIYSYYYGYLKNCGDFVKVGTNDKKYLNNTISFVSAEALKIKAPLLAENNLKRTIRRKPAGSLVLAADVDKGDPGAYFKSYKINKGDDVYNRIRNKSFRPGGRIALSSLRYIKVLHYDYKGKIRVGELIVNRRIAEKTTAIFKDLYQHKYQIKSMWLGGKYYKGSNSNANALKADDRSLAAGNTAAFNYRTISGRSTLSYHALGLAVDLNTFENPCAWGGKCYPPKATKYLYNRSRYKHTIDPSDYAYKLFAAHGFFWGGKWSNPKDYQHFEYQK